MRSARTSSNATAGVFTPEPSVPTRSADMPLTREDNDLLTRVENGAPMGEMIRQHYWLPAVPSARLVADGAPVRVRLLGSNYVAFRRTDGAVGVLDELCPHRKTSLLMGRNEDNGLRCIYHGW